MFPNHVWAADFVFDQTTDGRVLKVLTVTDEFTKTALAIKVERSITGDHLVRILDRLVAVHGHPMFIRMDNGPEMTCDAIADWCRFSATGSVFIEPGSPWQNAFVESFNGKLRDELLAITMFHSQLEAKAMAEDYHPHYNTYRPHSSLGYRTPNEFTLDWNTNNRGHAKTLAHYTGAVHFSLDAVSLMDPNCRYFRDQVFAGGTGSPTMARLRPRYDCCVPTGWEGLVVAISSKV